MSDLETLPNVGPATAETLEEAGYGSVQSVADADATELADAVTHWNQETALETIDGATTESESASDETDVDVETITFELTQQGAYQLLHVVLNEATSQLRSSQRDLAFDAYSVADAIRESMGDVTQTGDSAQVIEVPATDDALNCLHRACSQGFREYQSAPGTIGVAGTFNQIKEQVDNFRFDE